MTDINGFIANNSIEDNLKFLTRKSLNIKPWCDIEKDYDPRLHHICLDTKGRRDKVHSDGTVSKAARIPIGLEKLLTFRLSEFEFAIPVKRIYHYDNENTLAVEAAKAIEKVYFTNHINTVNIDRAISYNASCEIITLWYAQHKENGLYGFPSEYKLKCLTLSPMNGASIYPIFDEMRDLEALSIQYKKFDGEKEVTFFETFTAERHWKYQKIDNADWEVIENGEEIIIGKIPAIYLYRNVPCFEGLQTLREELEYTLSRNSDVLAYNSAPVLKVVGNLVGEEQRGETRRIYRVTDGGDVSYVSWQQSVEALKYHVDTMVKMYFMQSQMPDISFENLKSLGNIGYDARKTLLSDAHLKVGQESGAWIEFFEREASIIKSFLKKIKVGKDWETAVDSITIEHVITPFVQEDEADNINRRLKANGGKALESQLESIQRLGLSSDPTATYKQIQDEEMKEAQLKAVAQQNLFSAL